MRYVALAFFVIYILFAYWQLNDSDPIWWVTLYLVPAFVSFKAFQQKYNLELLITLSALYFSNALNSWLQISAYEGFFMEDSGLSMKTYNQELAREVAGLSTCIFSYLTYAIYYLFQKENLDRTNNIGIPSME